MQEGRITFKFKLGGAFDLLCLVGAGAIAVHSLAEMSEAALKIKLYEDQKTLIKVREGLKELSEKLKNIKEAKAEEKKEEEES